MAGNDNVVLQGYKKKRRWVGGEVSELQQKEAFKLDKQKSPKKTEKFDFQLQSIISWVYLKWS